MLKSLKKNQVVIYVIALMLVAAGYLNYTATGSNLIQANSDPELTYQENIADIGDATLVNSNDVKEEKNDTDSIEENDEKTNLNTEAQKDIVSTSVDNIDDYFSSSKLERDNMYSQMIETYQNIINSNTVSEEQKNIATQEITKINNNKNAIMICENLLGTKGLDKNVIFMNGENVSVVVKVDGGLAENQVAQIQNVVSREMKVDIQNITITEK